MQEFIRRAVLVLASVAAVVPASGCMLDVRCTSWLEGEEDVGFHASLSNSGWMILPTGIPKYATEVEYRLGDGAFRPMRGPSIGLPAGQEATTIALRYFDAEGEQGGPFEYHFDPKYELQATTRRNLEMVPQAGVVFSNGSLAFTHLVVNRCALEKVEYGVDSMTPDRQFDLAACDGHMQVREGMELFVDVPKETEFASVRLTYSDGTQSDIIRIER